MSLTDSISGDLQAMGAGVSAAQQETAAATGSATRSNPRGRQDSRGGEARQHAEAALAQARQVGDLGN